MNNYSDIFKKVTATISVIAVSVVATLLIAVKLVCSDIAPSAKQHFVTSLPETGMMRSIASWFLSSNDLQQLINADAMLDETAPEGTTPGKGDLDGIELKEISGPTFYGKMLIVKDPSRVKISSIYPWRGKGVVLDELVRMADAIGGINSGLYVQGRNTGGRPQGIVVCDGVIQNNDYAPYQRLIGLDRNNVLRIINLNHKSKEEIEGIVKKEGIRDCVCFPEEAKDESNWMVEMILNGEERKVNGLNCCINPRTVIGQRADGAILLLATDGRGAGSHIGATAVDIIKVMKDNNAITAANLDGGSSTCMYYNGKYEMGCTTFYYANSSWNFPTAFVISKK